MPNASSVNKPTSTTPTIFRASSTTGNARNLCMTNASHASSSVRRYSNGLNWTWLTTGAVLAMAVTSSSSRTLKFETPIERA